MMRTLVGTLGAVILIPLLAVGAVLGGADTTAVPVAGPTLAANDPGLGAAVLAHPNLRLRAAARRDIEAGGVDPRLLAVLLTLADRYRLDAIGPLSTGHSLYVAGTARVSNHIYGRAVDLPLVNGIAVSPTNRDAYQLVLDVLALPVELRPTEIGCPWLIHANGQKTFTRNHADHIHLGWDE